MTVIIFLIVLAVLIFVHELGHFVAARLCGVRVDAFKIGFGPKVVAWKRGETEYGINWIPFGGYVKIFGEDPNDENTSGPEASRSFVHKPRWQQAIMLVSGVLMNFIFAWVIYVCVFATGVTASTYGFEKYSADFSNPRVMVTDILSGSPADKAGLKDGDTIISIGGAQHQSLTDIQSAVNDNGAKPLTIQYLHDSVPASASITPESGLVDGKYAIGIAMDTVVDMRLPIITAVGEGLHYTVILIKETVVGLYDFIAQIFAGHPDFSQVAGPVGIAGVVGNAAAMGFSYLLMVTAIISINLGVVNLIPFPALDGGRTLFVLIEGIIRRRISPKFTNTVNVIGFAALMILMVAVTWKDIAKLVK